MGALGSVGKERVDPSSSKMSQGKATYRIPLALPEGEGVTLGVFAELSKFHSNNNKSLPGETGS